MFNSLVGPALYKYSKSSYFNEAEYTLNPGQWIRRFWDVSTYEDVIVPAKKRYDPDTRFACRHCAGDITGDNLGN